MATSDVSIEKSKLSAAKLELLEKRVQRARQQRESAAASEPKIIARRPDRTTAPLSFAQQRLWFIDQLEPSSSLYNKPSAVRLTGRLNTEALEQTLSEIVRRHEVLRTRFVVVDEEPVQVIDPPQPVQLKIIDLSQEEESKREQRARELAAAEARQPFDLSRGPLIRVSLLRLAEEEHVVLFTISHIIGDGWSIGILIREVATLYAAYSTGKPSPLPELAIQYGDFAHWQRHWLTGEVLEEQISYWRNQLAGAPAVLDLPTDHPRKAAQTHTGTRLSFTLPETLSRGLKELSRREGVTLFMTMLAAFQAMLARYSGQEDIVVGTAIANRNQSETEALIGFFANTLVLRSKLTGNPTVREMLQQAREVCLGAYAHQDMPFEKLVEELQPERSLSYSPLFQVTFGFENVPGGALELPGLKLNMVEQGTGQAIFDLSLGLVEVGDILKGLVEYNTDLFETKTIERMVTHFELLLNGFVADPEQRLSTLPLISSPEQQLIAQWNDTERDYRQDICIHHLFESQAARTPDAPALTFNEESLTYQQLNARANQLAHHLISSGVTPESTVGILLERSPQMVISVLAIWKAGAAYVPLDPSHPAQRWSFILSDAAPRLLISEQRLAESLPSHSARLVLLDSEADIISRSSTENPAADVEPEHLCYVIYTSGSTGQPKGVEVEHRHLVNTMSAVAEQFRFTETDVVPCLAPFSFDIFLFELLSPLLAGGRSLLLHHRELLERTVMSRVLDEVTFIHSAPGLMRQVVNFVEEEQAAGRYTQVRALFVGGDAVPPELVQQMHANFPSAEVIVGYGPTEATIMCAATGVERGVPVQHQLIGKAMGNTQLRLYDKYQNLVPIGVTGEIYIGGRSVTRGYLNREELTQQKYVEIEGERYYRSGDLGRYLGDGVIAFAGRADTQVKVRGYRIELGEIEAVLSTYEGIKESVVVVREERAGDQRLVAYVVAAEGATVESGELRRYLQERMPEYMVPGSFVQLDKMPLTELAKIDRKALPAPEGIRGELEHAYVAPRTAVEEVLAGIWAEVLKVDEVGVHDNFFELGGHSLLATQLISRVRSAFQIELPLRSLFEQPTIAGFSIGVERALKAGAGLAAPPLVPVSRDQALPLSFAQQRLWFIDQLQPGSALYNMPSAVRLSGRLAVAALEQTLTEIVRRHEALRTRFVVIDEEPVQVIDPPRPVQLTIIDLSQEDEDKQEQRARELAEAEGRQPFDLSRGPLLRASLLRLSEEDHIALLTVHHIVSDGWSMGILIREVAALYAAYISGKQSPLPELSIQYGDFAHWQRQWLSGEVLEQEIEYWRKQLAGAPPVLELPLDHPRPPVQGHRGGRETFSLSEAASRGVHELSKREGVTLFMTLLAAWQTLLARYSGQEDIVVGTAIANRNQSETEALIGFFTNTLVLRSDLTGDPQFRELLGRVREVCLGAYAHQDMPFEKLVEELQPERSMSYSPFFQVVFGLENVPESTLELPGLTLSPVPNDTHTSKFDLSLGLVESRDGIHGVLEYNTDLFEATTTQRLLRHFRLLLEAVTANPSQRLSELPILTEAERHQLLVQWNSTQAEHPAEKCLHELFEAQAERTPEKAAVVLGEQQLSYAELDRRANQVAHYLRERGVGAEVRVGVSMQRSFEMVAGLLGVLKAGAAYVPLDPAYPQERLAFMIEDAGVRVLLTQQQLLERLPECAAEVVCLDTEWPLVTQRAADKPESGVTSDNLAYIIYTSGSTGRPKGVMIEHRGICNLATAQARAFDVRPDSSVLQFASSAFDASVSEIFMALVSGATLSLGRGEEFFSGPALLSLLKQHEITTVTLPPALLAVLPQEELPALETIIAAGERCPAEVAARWSKGRNLFNAYGPTETTVCASIYRCEESNGDAPPIGRPMANVQVYLLDNHLQPVPVGAHGEVYIGGIGVGRGYANRPELTAERFIPDAFGGEAGARLYKTGDLARYRADGNIEFLGRIDHQVKVRGFRIELGEIESVLEQHPAVLEAVVLAREDVAGDQRLVAYVVSEQPEQATSAELRRHLKELLPEYMIPSSFMQLEKLPLTPNGKVDRRALPAPEGIRGELEHAYVAPRTAVEEVLAGIWAEVLKVNQVGVHDNFFEMGGHSLLATQLISRVRSAFQIELPLRSLFEQPTIAGFSIGVETALRAGHGVSAPPLVPVPGDQALPLSFAQQRLWFIDQLQPGTATYNIPSAVRLSGRLNIAALEQTLTEILRRHEALRTRFVVVDEEPVQVIEPPQPVQLTIIDLSQEDEDKRDRRASELAGAEARQPFDLSRGPLLRASLLRLSEEEHVALLTVHHIVSDGWSMGVLVQEVATLYEAFLLGKESPLPELAIQYGDFAHWQRQWLSGEVLEQEVEYWRKQLAGAPPVLELPLDHVRPPVQGQRGGRLSFNLSEEVSRGLKELSKREGVTLFMTLLAAWQTLLSRYSGQDDICVGTPIANRNRAEVEKLIGFFVNTLVMRADLSGDPTVRELLQQVREVCLGAYAHQDMPFEKLVEELQPERSMSYSPLFQVMFVLQNAPMGELQLPGLKLSPVANDGGSDEVVKFDMTLMMQEARDIIGGSVVYNKDLFEAETIARMLSHFQTLLAAVAANPNRRLSELQMLSPAERQQLLVEWNFNETDYPRRESIQDLFQEQAARAPEAVALVLADQQLTYAELNRRANQLAHYLRERGVGAEVRVGISMQRSLEMVIGILAVLKAGGAYLPLDASYPHERLAFMIEDAGVSLLLTQEHLRESLSGHSAEVVCLDTEWPRIAERSNQNLEVGVGADNLAYVMYTSGSTGKPKGVAVSHRNVVRLVKNTNYASFSAEEVFLQFAPISFDASTFEMWGALLNGARLVVFPADTPSLEDLGAVLRQHGVTTLWLTAQLFHQMVDHHLEALGGVRQLLAGGDVLSVTHVRKVLEELPECRLINGYGPTENTTFTTCYAMSRETRIEGSVPIGRPVANTRVYILDRRMEPVGVGIYGELCIGGDGVARGYLNRAELTAERFICDRFSTEAGARMYRTGDLARYRGDGEIEFLGRIDHQVKVRGFRIELGEIETVLAQHPSVKEAVVLAREDVAGDQRLVAYVVAEQPEQATSTELRRHLKERLPEYMIPSSFMVLDAMPLTANGKVDRRALPAPDAARLELEHGYVAPRTAVEEVLASVWSEVLRVERVGVHDNFFELGGHSLLATQLISRVRDAFQIELPLRTLFEQPTIAGFSIGVEAALRAGGHGVSAPPLVPVSREQKLPLSFAQQRMWFINQLQPNSGSYNIPNAVGLTGHLNVPALEQTMTEIFRRHEVLRTSFLNVDGEPVLVINPPQPVKFTIIDLSQLEDAERREQASKLGAADAREPFDLTRGPLVRATLLRMAEDEHIALFTMHHIISDGWSMGVMTREIATLYEVYLTGKESPLPELAIQYADFAYWQKQLLTGEVLEEQLSYWKQQLANAPAVLQLPMDHPRPPARSHRGSHQKIELSEKLSQGLKELSRREGVTMFMTLLAAWQVLLSRYSGQDDICIGTPIANRTRGETEALIGFFVNTLVMRSDLSGDPRFTELLQQVREVCLGAYAHQDMPFEKLVEELQPERSLSHSPLFQVMFVLQNAPMGELQLPGLKLSPVANEGPSDEVVKFDMTLMMQETKRGVKGSLAYDRELFEDDTMKRLVTHFETLLTAIVANPSARLSRLPLLTSAEEQQLLHQWNDTAAPYPPQLVHQLFEEQVRRTPDAVALESAGGQMSYAELNARANQLAQYLRSLGVGVEQLVGVLMERSVEMVVALLGILKAGGAYVPLDPTYPAERLSFMLEDARLSLLLTQANLLADIPEHQMRTVCVDRDWDRVASESKEDFVNDATVENLAYIIYTSGSTGKPKGVMITHRGLVNYLSWCTRAYPVTWGEGVPVHSSISFDLTVTSMFSPLLTGQKVFLLPEDRGIEKLSAALNSENRFSLLKITPSHVEMLSQLIPAEAAKRVGALIIGGEALIGESLAFWREHSPETRIINEYGPTETVVGCCTYEVPPETPVSGAVPIGVPIANTQLYILDSQLQPVPISAVGELYIGGAGVARGYLRRPELTAERFVPNPFSTEAGARMYRTGDLARYRGDGEIEFLGRIDHQVKVRGFRIELGEIESVLAQHPSVKEAVVLAREDVAGDQRLVAYVVSEQAGQATSTELRRHLKERLPDYMVPSSFMVLDAMPLTANGKVDRRALPAPERTSSGKPAREFIEPRDVLELKLAQIWEDILGVEQVGVRDNFFDLGGHSLLATRLMSRIEQVTGQKLPLTALFRSPTIEHLAGLLRQGDAASGQFSSLVEIQTGLDRRPLFCVHPSGGNVLCYAELARQLGADQPVYAFQAQSLNKELKPHTTVEEMATHYIGLMRAVQPEGPYLLAAWSMGGMVAFEMAQQLEAQGQKVAMLALLDVQAPNPPGVLPALGRFKDKVMEKLGQIDPLRLITNFGMDMGFSLRNLPLDREKLAELEPEAQLEYVIEQAKQHQMLPPGLEEDHLRHLFRVFKTNSEAQQNYVGRIYKGRATLFISDDRFLKDLRDPVTGWAKMVPNGFEYLAVPGDHYSMIRKPNVKTLAARLRAQLDKALSEATVSSPRQS